MGEDEEEDFDSDDNGDETRDEIERVSEEYDKQLADLYK